MIINDYRIVYGNRKNLYFFIDKIGISFNIQRF
jgi:hypothetical protein